MKHAAALVASVLLLSMAATSFISEDAKAAGTDTSAYSNVDSYYYNGTYVKITETIDEPGTVTTLDGSAMEFDYLKTEYLTYPNSDQSLVYAKYYSDNTLVYMDYRDYRNADGDVEADVDGEWVTVVSDEDGAASASFVTAYVIPMALYLSVSVLVGIAYLVYEDVSQLLKNGIDNSSNGTSSTITQETLIENEITVYFLDGEPYVVDVAGISAPVYEFCDETLGGLDAFVYYLVVKSPLESENAAESMMICPLAFSGSYAKMVMGLNTDLYHVWTAYGDWAESPCRGVAGYVKWEFHYAVEELLMYDHYHAVDSLGNVSNSMSFYGFSWGALYESDDPDNWQAAGLTAAEGAGA